MKKYKNLSSVKKSDSRAFARSKDEDRKTPVITPVIDSVQPFTASTYKHSEISHYKPTDIEKNIAQVVLLKDSCNSAFEFPIKIYSETPTKPLHQIEWPSIYAVKSLNDLNPYSKLAYDMIFFDEKNTSFVNNYKKYQGKYDILPIYQETHKNATTSTFVDTQEGSTSTETDTGKNNNDEEMVKIVRGISKKGILDMYPPVENISVLSAKWITDKKKLRPRYITLYQETPDSYYMLEIKNNQQSKSVRRWINLEFCSQIKQGTVGGKKTLELYVNELIYVFTSAQSVELNSWMTTLCTVTGLEMDVQTGNTKSFLRFGNKSMNESDVWKTSDLSQLSEYSSESDRKLISKMRESCQKLFNIYHCLFQTSPNNDDAPKKETQKTYVTLQIKSITFDLRLDNNDSDKPIEPYVIDCFLYDANINKKISENVYFDLQNEALINLDIPLIQHNVRDVVKLAKSDFTSKKINNYVFEINNVNDDIFLMLRVMKLYDGGHYYDAYMKPDNKLAKKQCEYASILSKSGLMYMTYFASAHKRVFDNKKGITQEDEQLPLFKFDHKCFDIQKYLKETSQTDVKSKVLTYPGGKLSISMKMVPSLDNLNNILTSSFEPLKTSNTGTKKLINSGYTILSSSLIDTRKYICPPFETLSNDLFIYPLEVNMTNCKSQVGIKNVIIEFHIKDDNQRVCYPLFYSRYGNICMTETDSCTIVPKTLHPTYTEEFRVMLPQEITENLHILIAYYSIDTKRMFKEVKSKKLPKCLLGYSWVKITPKHGEYDLVREVNLPAVSTLPDLYSKYDMELPNITNETNNDLKWMDGQGKPIIKLKMHYRSNIICFDPTFKELADKTKSTPLDLKNVEEFSKLIKVCHVIGDLAITNGYNVIFQWLTNFLILTNKLKMKSAQELDLVKSTTSLIIHILNRLVSKDYGKILGEYVCHQLIVYNNDGGYVHASLLRGLYEMVHIDPKKLESTFQNSWFLTKILLKSFKVQISKSMKYKQGNRVGIIDQTTEEHLRWFMHSMIKYVINKAGKKSLRVMKVNSTLAKFSSELLNILDRNFVVGMISYVYETYKYYELQVEGLCDLKFDFLKILSRNEFFLPINVPSLVLNKNLISSGQNMTLSQKYFRVHYIAAIITDEVERSLTLSINTRTEAILLFRDLLIKHHFDDRYVDKNGNCMGIIMALYVPFLSMVVENTHLFLEATKNKENSEKNDESHFNSVVKMSSTYRSSATLTSASSFQMGNNRICSSNFDIIAQQSHSQMSLSSNTELINKSLLFNNTRDLLICFLYIIQNVNKDYLISWWTNFPKIFLKGTTNLAQSYLVHLIGEKGNTKHINYLQFFTLLQVSIDVFQYDNNIKMKKEFVLESLSNHIRKEGTTTLGTKSKLKRSQLGDSTFATTDNSLFQEITVLILDTIEMFCKSQKMTLKMDNGNNAVMKIILETYLHIFSSIHSRKTIKYYLAHMRLFIQDRYFVIFKGNNSFLEKLFLGLFEKLPFLDSEMRNEISLFIYMVLKANFNFTGNSYQRSYIKLICASTQIMDNNLVAKFVLRCVSGWTRLIKDDLGAKGNEFTNEIIDLNRRIQSILKIGQRMKKHVNDIETSIDVLYNLSNTFSETPEILINWYSRMADTHEKNGFYSEAAMCALHSAVVYVQLLKCNDAKTMKDDIEFFRLISNNIRLLNYASKKDETSDYDSISTEHLYRHLIKTSEYLAKAQRYEAISTLFKCIIPIFERDKYYAELGQIYKNMSDAYNNISDKNAVNNRNFGAYYRVAFYGKGFCENGGKNFIYKEPPYTPLASIKERLENIYTNSVKNLRVILEGGTVKTDSLDPELNYIQINGVIPIDEYKKDSTSNLSVYDIHTNVRAFVLEIPFTPSGKAHGGIENQWKRVTIFHSITHAIFNFYNRFLAYHEFPYMKKRLNVTHKIVTELTPIKVAIDEMSLQVKQLQDVVNMYPPDMKRLQLKLQGSVSVQVNAGPVGYANTFASKNAEKTYPKPDIETLRNVFREFLSQCEKALQINSELVQSDQLLYHMDMSEKFESLKNTINGIIDDQPSAPK